jgi:hypothetical protein
MIDATEEETRMTKHCILNAGCTIASQMIPCIWVNFLCLLTCHKKLIQLSTKIYYPTYLYLPQLFTVVLNVYQNGNNIVINSCW